MADRGAGQNVIPLSPYSVQIQYRGNAGQGSSWFGPLAPQAPSAPPEVAGRQFDFQTGYNLGTQPKLYEGVSFAELRALADGWSLLRLVIETRKDQVERMAWSIKPRDAKKAKTSDSRIAPIEAFFRRPSGRERWSTWLRRVLEDLFVIDAPSMWCQRNRGGALLALQPIDGATIKPVVDDWGRTPDPIVQDGTTLYPVAYQQILKGVPAVDYTTRDLIYRPRNVRTHRVYGFSPVEQIITIVNIALRRDLSTLSYYTEGNVPDSLIGVPDTWSPDQVQAFQSYWDAYFAGNVGARRHAKFVPGGVGKFYRETKEPELKGEYDEWLAKVVCFAFSISPQALTKQMNRASADTQKEIAEEEGLAPILAWIKDLADEIIADEFGAPDLELDWVEDTQADPAVEEQILTSYATKGAITLNEVRDRIGLDKSSNPAADVLMVLTATGYVPIEANTIEGKKANLDAFGPPPANPFQNGNGSERPDGTSAGPESEPGAEPPPVAEKHVHAPFNKRRPGGAARPIPFDRPVTHKAMAAIGAVLTHAFAAQAQDCAAQVRAALSRLGKSDGGADADALPDPDATTEDITIVTAASIVAALGLSRLSSDAVVTALADSLGGVAEDAVGEAIASIGVEIGSDLVDQVNDRAVAAAADRAAELVGMRRIPVVPLAGGAPTFELVSNPGAEWAITDTTRDVLRQVIADGLVDNVGTPAIVERIIGSVAFSSERAELVAETEVARSNSDGAMAGYRAARDDAGVRLRKAWLVTVEACRICQANADQGAIELDEPFASGDDAPPGHPRCRCAVCPVVVDEAGKAYNPGQARDANGRWTSGLSAAIGAALARSSGVVRAIVGPVRSARRMEALTGVTTRGFKHSVTNQGIAHTLRMHGSATAEAARGQTAVTTSDFSNIAAIVGSPDSISLGSATGSNGQSRLVYEKTIAGVRYTYVGEIQAGKRRIEMVSMWKR